MKKEFLRRAGWLSLVILFLVTSLGVGVAAFWQATHQKDDTATQDQQKQPKVAGTKMKDFTPVAKVDSLQKIDQKLGSGAEAKSSSTVTVLYTGAVAATGVIFESSLDSGQPATFGLSQVIKGWQEGIPGMKVGGTRRLLIPAAQAYGPAARPGIPANSGLVFDVTLLAVK